MVKGKEIMGLRWMFILIGVLTLTQSSGQPQRDIERVVELNEAVILDSALVSYLNSFMDSIEPIISNVHQFGISMTVEWEKNQSRDSIRFVKSIEANEVPVSVYFSLYSAPTYIPVHTVGVLEVNGIPIIIDSYPFECSEVVRTNSLYRWRYLDSKNLVPTLLAYYEVRLENGVWDVKHYINKVKGINRVYHTRPK